MSTPRLPAAHSASSPSTPITSRATPSSSRRTAPHGSATERSNSGRRPRPRTAALGTSPAPWASLRTGSLSIRPAAAVDSGAGCTTTSCARRRRSRSASTVRSSCSGHAKTTCRMTCSGRAAFISSRGPWTERAGFPAGGITSSRSPTGAARSAAGACGRTCSPPVS